MCNPKMRKRRMMRVKRKRSCSGTRRTGTTWGDLSVTAFVRRADRTGQNGVVLCVLGCDRFVSPRL